MSVKISGEKYAMMYGPTTGDKVLEKPEIPL